MTQNEISKPTDYLTPNTVSPDPLIHQVNIGEKVPPPNTNRANEVLDGQNRFTIEQPASPTPHADGKEWTYLVNLDATLPQGIGASAGTPDKFDQLRELAKYTTDGNSQLLVQVSEADTNTVHVFKIADGNVQDMGTTKSQNLQQNIEHLVSMAPNDGKLALVAFSHGDGNGMEGDVGGHASLSQLHEGIAHGLTQAGRGDKLDAISLDGCLMASANALGDLSRLANGQGSLLASELFEWGGKGNLDGQALAQGLKTALQHPPATGRELGMDIAGASAGECEKTLTTSNEACGTETIGTFDPRYGQQFSQAISGFGDALTRAVQNPETKQAIETLIKQLPDLSGHDQLRDMEAFASGIQQAIKDGRIKDDPDHSLEQASQRAIEAEEKMKIQFYTTGRAMGLDPRMPWQSQVPPEQHPALNGVSTFLPTTDYERDPAKRAERAEADAKEAAARSVSALEKLAKNSGKLADSLQYNQPPSPTELRRQVSEIAQQFALGLNKDGQPGMPGFPDPRAAKIVRELRTLAMKPVISAEDLRALSADATNAAHQPADKVPPKPESPFQQELSQREIEEIFKRQMDRAPDGWQHFIIAMRGESHPVAESDPRQGMIMPLLDCKPAQEPHGDADKKE